MFEFCYLATAKDVVMVIDENRMLINYLLNWEFDKNKKYVIIFNHCRYRYNSFDGFGILATASNVYSVFADKNLLINKPVLFM